MKKKLTKFITLCVLMLLFTKSLMASEQLDAAKALYPVRWTAKIKIKDLKDVEARINKPVDLSVAGEGDNELILTNDNDEKDKVKIHTVKEWWDYRRKGYAPYSTYDITMAGWFTFEAGNLQFLKTAIPSKISYLSNFVFSKEAIKYLPASLISGYYDDDEIANAISLSKLGNKLKVKVIDDYNIEIEYEDMMHSIKLLAWGDFNHDGIEDILVHIAHYAVGGTMRDYQSAVLTRKEKDGNLFLSQYVGDTYKGK